MYSELSFLFTESGTIENRFKFQESKVSADDEAPTDTQSIEGKVEFDESKNGFVFNKYVVTKDDNNNFIKSSINQAYGTKGKNPYVQLLTDFEENSESLKLKASDFAYLRDIGVFPINRLMILRRFPEGATVPTDLNDLQNTKPISVVIGWIKEENDLLEFNFHEKWTPQNKRLDELLNDIMKDGDEGFGIDFGKMLPVPGWGEGFMFGIYNKLGLTNYDNNNIPVGDPNLLKESITRDVTTQGLESSLNFKLETMYEQKYIGGVDQNVAFMDILSNLTQMGTSDMRYLGKLGNDWIEKLKTANNDPSNPTGWAALIVGVTSDIIDILQNTLDKASNVLNVERNAIKSENTQTGTGEAESTGGEDDAEKSTNPVAQIKSGVLLKALDLITSITSTILASTVARKKWAIRGAIGQMTGEATTPWHLTIGNPYAPLLSMNNIYVKNVNVKFKSEMAVNDMPKFIDVSIELEQGRNLGKQELNRLFGVEYQRKYKKI